MNSYILTTQSFQWLPEIVHLRILARLRTSIQPMSQLGSGKPGHVSGYQESLAAQPNEGYILVA